MPKVWLRQRWETFFPAVADVGNGQEERLKRLCEEELAAWRARPKMSASSLRVPLTDTRNEIKKIPLTEHNSWLNPRTGKREHLGLKYLNVSEEEWAAMNAPSEAKLQQRFEDVQLVKDHEGLVATATTLLQSKQWEEIVVALAVLTGRRLSEVLKSGMVVWETPYTVVFSGQLKRRDKILDPYEIPTLCEARLVVEAWERLRTIKECSEMEGREISTRLGPVVSQAADTWFSAYVPPRSGRASLYTHLFRTIYARIALLYFAPETIVDIKYMSRIQGHYWVVEATGKQKDDYMATLHYNDYRIADGEGHIDGRQGIKLGLPGVSVLKVFEQKEKQNMAPRKKSTSTEVMTSEANKTGYSMMRPKQTTRVLLNQEKQRLDVKSDDELLLALLKRSRAYDALSQDGDGVGPMMEFISEVRDGHDDPVAYLRSLVIRDANFRHGLEKRNAGLDYRSMRLSDLEKYKTEPAAQERFRRAVAAIMTYNEAQEEPLKRWFINPNTVRELVGGRYPAVKAYLDTHQSELDAHHEQYALKAAYNRKPIAIKEMVQISEPAQVAQSVAVDEEEMFKAAAEDQE